MSTKIFVNLPVKDLKKSTDFFGALGFMPNPQFSDENASSIVISEEIYVMLLVEPYFRTFTKKTIVDSTKSTEAILALSVESREAVDTLADKALAAGGQPSSDAQDLGFMYSRAFQDVDGHLWELVWMNPEGTEGGA